MIAGSADQFKELSDHAPVMIWRAGPDKLCDFFNKPWLDFTGRTLEQELGNGWTEGVHQDDLQHCLSVYTGSFDARRDFSMDYRLRRHDGEYRWVLDHGRPYYRANGEFAGYFGSCIDITERKLGEERLKEALADQDHMLRERDVLTAEIHHRVRNNLQVMLGLVGLSMRHATDPGCQAVLESFADRIQALAIVQTHLHEASKVSEIDLKTYARELAGALSGLYQGDQVTISISGDRYPLPPHDANTVGLILSELLSNSFKHAFRGGRSGTITIRIATEGEGAARLAVADDGPGFDDKVAQHPGGIGLTLVRTYANQIGARIARVPASGTRFEIALPARH
ncbi:MAG: PAS domain S-box protein [Pseudomonadota bacterium]|nr:PAS domain S-box protein [Pseudomonadota bacterium]